MLTDSNLLTERPHPGGLGGVQRLYRFKDGHGLSVVNSSILHHFPFAWEIAALEDVSEDGESFELTYDTPLTENVEVFDSDEDTNEFIAKAKELFEGG